MKILQEALNKINPIRKDKRDFFIALIQGLIGSVGKKTFRNLARFTQMAEHTFSRQMVKAFDFVCLNAALIQVSIREGDILIGAQDASFVQKSGKKTYGIDFFWNGCEGKAEKGLETDTIAIIRINGDQKAGYALSTEQTLANPIPMAERPKNKKAKRAEKTKAPKGERAMAKKNNATKKEAPIVLTRIDAYLDHLKRVAHKMIELGVKYMAVDAAYTKNKYINGVVAAGLHAIGKLRIDARLLRIYTGLQNARGRKRLYEKGKINAEDFKNSVVTKIDDEGIELRSCIAHSVSLDRQIKVVWVKKTLDDGRSGEAYLFSTDTEIDTLQLYKLYVARFQIEFIFRDAKGFTGFTDCQSRDARRLHYHFNASLVALNVAKLQDQELQEKEGVQYAFSMTNWARKYHVGIVINRFIAMLGLDQTSIKSHPDYESMLSFGGIMH